MSDIVCGRYTVRTAPEGFQVLAPSGTERALVVVITARSVEAAMFFVRAAIGASVEELRREPFITRQSDFIAPEPVITQK